MNGWIGVDLDGTLAEYDGWQGHTEIGAPIPAMVERVKRWLAEGHEVRIFTARMFDGGPRAQGAIAEWTIDHIGTPLVATCVKDFGMVELWDDRAVSVEPNTGRALSPSRRGLDADFACGGVVPDAALPETVCIYAGERVGPHGEAGHDAPASDDRP